MLFSRVISFFFTRPSVDTKISKGMDLTSETAIKSASQDLLGRKRFSEVLATVLSENVGDQSRVVALRGSWGSGKTSIKNMCLEIIYGEPKAISGVVEFNPWQWETDEAITRAFYQEIAVALGHTDQTVGRRSRAAKFRRYAEMVNAIATGTRKQAPRSSAFVEAYTAIGALSLLTGFLLPAISSKQTASYILIIAGSLSFLAAIIRFLGRERARLEPLDIRSFDLKKELMTLDKNLLVVIDDIDRLEPENIRSIFRLVKANADFPRISYLLLYQRDIVDAAFAEFSKEDETKFVDKIIQTGFDIPVVESARVEKVFLEYLNAVVGVVDTDLEIDPIEWANLWGGSLRKMFRTLRDVKRFNSGLQFRVKLHSGERTFELHIIDVIAIEAIRYFEPKFYDKLASSKEILLRKKSRADYKKEIKSLLDEVGLDEDAPIVSVAGQVFPTIDQALSPVNFASGYSDEDTRNRRARTDRFFDRYFLLAIPDKEISESDLASFLDIKNSISVLKAKIEEYSSKGLLEDLLFRIDEINKTLPVQLLPLLLPLLFDLGQKFPADGGFSLQTPFIAIWRTCSWYIQVEPDKAKRAQIFATAISESTGLTVPGTVIGLDIDLRNKPEDQRRDLTFDDDGLTTIKSAWLKSINYRSADPHSLVRDPHFIRLLYQWKEFDGIDGPKRIVQTIVSDDSLIILLLIHLRWKQSTLSVGDHAPRSQASSRIKQILPFIDRELIVQRLRNIQSEATIGDQADIELALNVLEDHA